MDDIFRDLAWEGEGNKAPLSELWWWMKNGSSMFPK